MTSSVRGADGENLQNTETISGTLSESPKLTFAQDAGDDTVSRNEGTWDTDGRFAICQKVTIAGALVAWTSLHISRRIHFSGEMWLNRLDDRPQGNSQTIAQGRSFKL